jgi:hypothetical protein
MGAGSASLRNISMISYGETAGERTQSVSTDELAVGLGPVDLFVRQLE